MSEKLQAIWATIKTQLADIWNRSKMVIIAIAAILAAIEFQKIKEFLLVYMGQKEIDNSKKEDADLAKKETQESAQADVLVKQAEDLPKEEKPVTDVDWYKAKK